MNLWIARKYFFSFNKGSAINIISLITVLGLMFSTMAMIFAILFFDGLLLIRYFMVYRASLHNWSFDIPFGYVHQYTLR